MKETFFTFEIYKGIGLLFFQFLKVNDRGDLGFDFNLERTQAILSSFKNDLKDEKEGISKRAPELTIEDCERLLRFKEVDSLVITTDAYMELIHAHRYSKDRTLPDFFFSLYKGLQIFYQNNNQFDEIRKDMASQLSVWLENYEMTIKSPLLQLYKENNLSSIIQICRRMEAIKKLIVFLGQECIHHMSSQQAKRLLQKNEVYQ